MSALAAAVLCGVSGVAGAGTYPMYQCRDGSGRYAPISATWSLSGRPKGQLYNLCSTQGHFGIRQTPAGATGDDGGSALALAVPVSRPAITMTRALFGLFVGPKTGDSTLSHGDVTIGSGPQQVDTQAPAAGSTSWIDRYSGPFRGSLSTAGPMGGDLPSGARDVALTTYCYASCYFSPPESAQIQQAVLTLREDEPPTLAGLGGTLLEPGPKSGLQTVSYDAGDADSGLKAVTVVVDGTAVARDDFSSSCAYTDFNACPRARQGQALVVDADRLPEGLHHASLVAEDAAGNSRSVAAGVFSVSHGAGAPPERGALNGTRATDQARMTLALGGRRSLTVPYRRRIAARGRLTASDGQPIAGARVELRASTLRPNATARPVVDAVTDANGRWRAVFAASMPSSRVVAEYRSRLGDAGPAASAAARLRVRAMLTLRAVSAVTRPRGVISLRGRVAGAPIPRRGKIVELRARGKGDRRWLTFRTLRTDAGGRFAVSYGLRRGFRGVVYEFVAVARVESGYPFETGRSGIARVAVR